MPLDSSRMRAFSWKPACNVVSGIKRIKLGAYVRFATLLFSVVRKSEVFMILRTEVNNY